MTDKNDRESISVRIVIEARLSPKGVWPDGGIPETITPKAAKEAMAESCGTTLDWFGGGDILRIAEEWNLDDGAEMEITVDPDPGCDSDRGDRVNQLDDLPGIGQGVRVSLRARPGTRLLELLEARGMTLADFARLLDPEVADVRGAVANLRQYTHAADPVWPKPEKVEAWAAVLDVDPSSFFSGS